HRESDRAAVAKALGAGDHVRRYAPMLDTEPLSAGASPPGLHFVADEDPAVIPHDLLHDLEVLLRRRDKPAHSLDRLGSESGDPPGGRRADQLLHILRAPYFAIRILQPKWTAVAVRIVRVHHARHRRSQAPRALPGDRHSHRRTAVIGVPQRYDLAIARVAT